MKTLKLLTGIFTLCILVASCTCNNEKDKPENSIAKFKSSKHLITIDESSDLYNNYKDRFRGKISEVQMSEKKTNSYDPTQYVLINIETLESYLKFLRDVENKNGGGDKKITGIAVFLGANNMNANILDKATFNDRDYKERSQMKERRDVVKNWDIGGRITTFLAPTYRTKVVNTSITSEIQRHIPFYITPDNKEEPYVGSYNNLMNKLNSKKSSEKQALVVQSGNRTAAVEDTSLNLNEFNDMPPKQPISNP